MAGCLEADLSATLPGSWTCEVRPDYVLVVRSDQGVEEVALDQDVDEDAWTPDAWAPPYRNSTLDDDASELIADEVQEVLRACGLAWPVCRTHEVLLTACSGVWTCSSSHGHDPADVGALTSGVVASGVEDRGTGSA